MKAYSRFIGILLTICMLIGSLPVFAVAEYIEAIQMDTFIEEQNPANESISETISEEELLKNAPEEVVKLEDVIEEANVPGEDAETEYIPAKDDVNGASDEISQGADVEIMEIIDEDVENPEDETIIEEAKPDADESALNGGASSAEDSFGEALEEEIIQEVMVDSYLAMPNTMDPVYFNGEDIEVEYTSNIVEVTGFEDKNAYSFEENVLYLKAENLAALPDGNYYLHLLLEDDSNCIQPVIISVAMSRGMKPPHSYLTAPPDGGMTIRDEIFTAEQLKDDQSGAYWKWDAAKQQITINGWNRKDSYDMDPIGYAFILIDRYANLKIEGSNSKAYVYSSKGIRVTGNGYMEGIINNSGSGDIDIIDAAYINANITNKSGKINIKNSKICSDSTIWSTNHDINITGSNIQAKYVDAGKNLKISGSVVYTTDQASYNDIYASREMSITDSVCIFSSIYGEDGVYYDKSVALFQKDYWEKIDGKLYNYFDYFTLRNSPTLESSFVLPNLGIWADGYAIAKGKKLTIKNGNSLVINDYCKNKGKISGSFKSKGLITPDGFDILCPTQVAAGLEIPIKLSVYPEQAPLEVIWKTDKPDLVSIDWNGNLKLTAESKNHIGETVRITASPTHSFGTLVDKSIVFTIVPVVETVEVHYNGEAVEEIDLWLDPVNNAIQLDAVVNPWDARQDVTWVSSSAKVAKVNEAGMVSARAAGTTYVHAIANDESGVVSQQVKVVVKKAPSSVKINPSAVALAYDAEQGIGTSCQLTTVLSKGSDSSITYKSGNEAIASVDENGLITASGMGKTKVTAKTFNKKSASCTVTIKPAPEQVKLNNNQLVIGRLDSFQFSADIPKGTLSDFTYKVNSDIASINSLTGDFYAAELGVCEVAVTTFNGKTDICTVKIVPEPEIIQLNSTNVVLGKGEKFSLIATPVLSDGETTTATIAYSIDNKKVATVSANGQITAKAIGKARITVSSHNGVIAFCDVLVNKAPSSVKLSKKSLTMSYDENLNLGTEYQLLATLNKNSESALTWKSSNEDIVKVDANGGLIATGMGKAKITVRTFNKKSASCTVTVKPAPIDLDLNASVDVISVGQTAKLTLSMTKGSAGNYSYSCEPEGIVEMNGDIVVSTGNAVGTVNITATAFNGVTDNCTIDVREAPDYVVLNPASITLGVGEKFTIQPITGNGSPANYTYSIISGSKKVSVNSSGKVNAKAFGTAEITVMPHLGKPAVFTVTILKAPKKITLSASKMDMKVGESFTLMATLPENSASKISWISSNKDVVRVDDNGNVVAVSSGSAIITAKTFNGKTAKCTIKVR